MIKETMTVHQALSELKLINKKIDKAIYSTFMSITSNSRTTETERNELTERYLSALQSTEDLIKRYSAIKCAVDLSNSTAKVVIAGKEMSVTEAIAYKNKIIYYKKSFLDTLKTEYKDCIRKVEEGNIKLERDARERAENIACQADKSGDSNIVDNVEAFFKASVDNHRLFMIEPKDIKLNDYISKLEDEIEVFLTNVDYALSVSNATTTLDVEY